MANNVLFSLQLLFVMREKIHPHPDTHFFNIVKYSLKLLLGKKKIIKSNANKVVLRFPQNITNNLALEFMKNIMKI